MLLYDDYYIIDEMYKAEMCKVHVTSVGRVSFAIDKAIVSHNCDVNTLFILTAIFQMDLC